MNMTTVDPRRVLGQEIEDLRTITAGLSDIEMTKPTACAGWHVADLITHLRLDMEEILQGLASATHNSVDRDATSYWNDWPPGRPAGFSEVRWLWAQSASYANASGLRSHFEDSAGAAQSASAHAPIGRISFQSHVMLIEDFLSMWITEFAVHHFDLIYYLEDRPPPSEEAIRSLIGTLEALTETPKPRGWDDLSFIRKATGRDALNADDVQILGQNAHRFPALG